MYQPGQNNSEVPGDAKEEKRDTRLPGKRSRDGDNDTPAERKPRVHRSARRVLSPGPVTTEPASSDDNGSFLMPASGVLAIGRTSTQNDMSREFKLGPLDISDIHEDAFETSLNTTAEALFNLSFQEPSHDGQVPQSGAAEDQEEEAAAEEEEEELHMDEGAAVEDAGPSEPRVQASTEAVTAPREWCCTVVQPQRERVCNVSCVCGFATPPAECCCATPPSSSSQPALPVQQGGSRKRPATEPAEGDAEDALQSGEPKLLIISESRRYVERFRTAGAELFLRIREPPEGVNSVKWLEEALEELYVMILSACQPTDKIGVEFHSSAFSKGPAGMSFRYVHQFTLQDLCSLVTSVSQSAAGFCIDTSFSITVTVVEMPVGAGGPKPLTKDDFSKTSICFITNTDNRCLPRAIAVGIVYSERGELRKGDLQRQWRNISRANSAVQTQAARDLVTASGVKIPQAGCGMPEIQGFQEYLAASGVCLRIFEFESFGTGVPPIFDGSSIVTNAAAEVVHRVNLLHYRETGHFNLIKELTAAAGYKFFCAPCGKAYNDTVAHSCTATCPHCRKLPPCDETADKVKCDDCGRYFRGLDCYQQHKSLGSHGPKSALCGSLKVCSKCLKLVYKHYERDHVCGTYYCRVCKQKRPDNHQCFMAPAKPRPPTKKREIFIFYDFETRQESKRAGIEDEFLHEVNLCVSQQRCSDCIGSEEESEACALCAGAASEKVFGDRPVAAFVDYVMSLESKTVSQIVCIAHNAKGFDSQFILRYLVEEKCRIPPTLIMNGTSIMSMQAGSVKFIDSLNYFHMPLSALPQAFGLGSNIFKGTFPHLFNKNANQNYVGKLPEKAAYDPDAMSCKNRTEFLQWYDAATAAGQCFDFGKELVEYCKSDVSILRRACAAFRKIFLDSGEVCPFTEATTIASACNKVYRRKFLEADTISVLPRNGYRRADKQSEVAIEWLLWCEKTFNTEIVHAGRGREHRTVDGSRLDGYFESAEQGKVALQFHGCFFHGCDRCYTDSTARDKEWHGTTMNDRFNQTLTISQRIRACGYTLHEMWECDFKKLKNTDPAIREHLQDHPILSTQPLDPRDAFFGGRTGNTRTFYEAKSGEKIHYVDVCSLYPYISKTGKFPTGHPRVYTADTCSTLTGSTNDLSSVEGLVRCRVLPPRNLYHPVLPVRMHNRLIFALCRTCCEEMYQGECCHGNVDDRAFEGTWVSCELQKAVEKGYQILNIYEIWQYSTEQYDRSTKTGGLFGGYINLWLKMKQEASGWPTKDPSPTEQHAYIARYFENEGIALDREKIVANPGLRSVAKLCLNSFWGKFGQRENLPKTEIVKSRQRILELLTDESCEVHKIVHVNDDTMYVCYSSTSESVSVNANTNVVIAAYTTAQARLKLYSYLEKLDRRVLYYDTDSCIYISTGSESEYCPPLGSLLGEMTDELTKYGEGSYIKSFVSGGPKFYGYLVKRPAGADTSECKVKGITLNWANTQIINFESICQLIKDPDSVLSVTYRAIRRTHLHQVITRTESKTCKPVLVKRRRDGEYDSLPYGYRY